MVNTLLMDSTWHRIDTELSTRKKNWAWLARELNTSDQTVHNWSARGVPSRRHADIARILGWSVDQLLGHEIREARPKYGQVNSAVAQPVILDEITVPSTISWGDIEAMGKLPARFTVHMPDDSLTGHIDRGTGLIFERDLAPTPGKTVLIEDGDGQRFIRIYALVRGDHWQAQAKAAGYVTLDSREHGLRVLATMKWREG
jgi:hypothetical protein